MTSKWSRIGWEVDRYGKNLGKKVLMERAKAGRKMVAGRLASDQRNGRGVSLSPNTPKTYLQPHTPSGSHDLSFKIMSDILYTL